MTTPRIRTWAESGTRWWVIVGAGRSEVHFGPHKRASGAKTVEDFLRRLAARDGWDKALHKDALRRFMEGREGSYPYPDPDRPSCEGLGRAAVCSASIRDQRFVHQPPQAAPWPVGCLM